jgi:hypothetical protein
LHNAFRDIYKNAVGTVAGVEFGSGQATGQQRDDDDRNQDDRLPVEESPPAPLLGRRWLYFWRRGRRGRLCAGWWRRCSGGRRRG